MKKIFFLCFLLAALALSGCVSGPDQPAGLASAGVADSTVSIPLEKIGSTANFFESNSGGTTVRFFAVRAGDGSIKTAFDACDVCFASKKGYRQEGTYLVCNNCGNKYSIEGIGVENKAPGGCWPGYLPSKVVGNSLVIQKADLDKGRGRFA
jgi:uncharacterized membrane protein